MARILALAALLSCTASAVADKPPVTAARIAEWIGQLADKEFAVREAATAELRKHPTARKAVEKARQSDSSPEVQRRTADILREFDRLAAVAELPKIAAHVKAMEADLFVARAARYTGNPDDIWQAVTDFGWAALDVGKDRQPASSLSSFPQKDFAAERKLRGKNIAVVRPQADPITRAGMCLSSGEGNLHLGDVTQTRLVAHEGPLAATWIAGFTFVNGHTTLNKFVLPKEPTPSARITGVLVCDGDIFLPNDRAVDRQVGGVVVCNGSLKFANRIGQAVVLAAGDVELDETDLNRKGLLSNVTIRAGGRVKLPEGFRAINCDIKENVLNPLAPFKFFALAEVGLHAKDVKKEVVVEKVDAKSPFGKAGVQAADVVVAVDGKAVADVAELRRRVRTGYVFGDCALVVRRGEAVKELVVRFPE